MRSILLASAMAVGCAVATPALADDAAAPPPDFTITGAAAIVSQYRFRGISQSDNKPVVQGTFTVAHKSGFYVSTWGSSASHDSSAFDIVDIGGTEIDVYGGFTHALGKTGLTIDVGGYGYIYPGSHNAVGFSENYYEIYGSLSYTYGPVTAKAGLYYAPNQKLFDNAVYNGVTHHNAYIYGELSSGIGKSPFSVHGHLGHTAGGFDYGGRQYFDFVAGVSYKWKALTFDVSAVGTNLSHSRLSDGGVPPAALSSFYRLGKTVPVASVTASF